MFEKSFVKYARAIWDENERRRMYKLHAAKTVAGGVFFLSLIVFVIIAYAFRSQIEAGDSAALTAVLIIILFICVASVVAVLVAEIVFNVKFSRILRPRAVGRRTAGIRKLPAKDGRNEKTHCKSGSNSGAADGGGICMPCRYAAG